jgi:hypothetical protein
MHENILNLLPPDIDLETKRVLKQLARSHRALAELKGYADTIPNKNILINSVTIESAFCRWFSKSYDERSCSQSAKISRLMSSFFFIDTGMPIPFSRCFYGSIVIK